MAKVRSSEIRRGGQGAPPHRFFFPPEYWAGERTVMFFSGCAWNATGGGQRPVALARVFARAGWNVLYYNWEATGSWWSGGPVIVSQNSLAEIMPALKQADGLLVCGLPSHVFYEPAIQLQRAGWALLYDTIDDWEAFHDGDEATWYKPEVEQVFITEADILTASAPVLAEKVRLSCDRLPRLVRNAGPSQPLPATPPPVDMRFGAAGTVVYVGYLYGHWFDWRLLEQSARDLPQVIFNIVGENGAMPLPKLPNMVFVGEKPYREAMRYVHHSDASIIPFKGDQLSAAVDPIKYYDAMAAGIPTVATACLSDLRGRENVVLALPNARSLAPAIRRALKLGRWGRPEVAAWLEKNCWSARADAMISLYDEWLMQRTELRPAGGDGTTGREAEQQDNEVPPWMVSPRAPTAWAPASTARQEKERP